MRLVALDAHFIGIGGEGVTGPDGKPVPRREGVGLGFNCPCGCGEYVYVDFENPLDGGVPLQIKNRWQRTGDTIETITLNPSILRVGGCAWHGWVRNGEAVSV